MRPILVDVSEFLNNPVRSGIQRVIRELIRHWPADAPVSYVRYDRDHAELVHVSRRHLDRAVDYRPDPYRDHAATAALLRRDMLAADSRPVQLRDGDRILVPELFYGQNRVSFYHGVLRDGRAKAHFIVFDFIPWFKPEEVSVGNFSAAGLMPYLALIKQARHRCFISAAVKGEFEQRIMRQPDLNSGPVIKLGCDGIRMEHQVYSSNRTDFICIGTLDGKKRQEVAFEAFRSLPPSRRGRFVCLGKISPHPAPWLHALLSCTDPDVEIIDGPTDDVLADRIRRARASVFVSTNEGYGLPAVESLHLGVPVVVDHRLPSLADLPSDGQIRVPTVSVDAVASALSRLTDDGETRRLWQEASNLRLPTWRDYATSLCEWVRSTASAGAADANGRPSGSVSLSGPSAGVPS